MKVLFALGLVLETLGLDVGFSRLLLTFLLQYVSKPVRSTLTLPITNQSDYLIRVNPSRKRTLSVYASCRELLYSISFHSPEGR
jgi:hypothetical protein